MRKNEVAKIGNLRKTPNPDHMFGIWGLFFRKSADGFSGIQIPDSELCTLYSALL